LQAADQVCGGGDGIVERAGHQTPLGLQGGDIDGSVILKALVKQFALSGVCHAHEGFVIHQCQDLALVLVALQERTQQSLENSGIVFCAQHTNHIARRVTDGSAKMDIGLVTWLEGQGGHVRQAICKGNAEIIFAAFVAVDLFFDGVKDVPAAYIEDRV